MPPEHANGSPVLDQDEPSSPLIPPQSGPPLTSLFGFGSLPGMEEETTGGPGDVPASDSETGWPSDGPSEPLDSDPSGTTSSPGSAAGSPLSKGQLKETFRAGVRISTSTAHRLGARTPGQQHVGLYLADEDDVKGIGDPLAEIAHRRGGLAGGKLSPDTNNALQAVMALAGYVAKQLKGVQTARQLDGQIAAGVVHVGDVDDEQVA